MIPLAAAFFVIQTVAPLGPPAAQAETDEGRAAECQAAVRRNPEAALETANRWRASGGGLHARQCIGLAYVAIQRWALAAATFEQAAQEADRAGEPRGADFWVQAGNARLAGGDFLAALSAFDAALASRHLTPELRGEVHLDRARAFVAQRRPAEARTALDQATELVPADPMVWYLSAALARQQNDLPRARANIARARELARDNPDVLLLAGTIAGQAGDMAEAERLYRQVAERMPESEAGRQARESLATLREVEVPAAAPATPPTPPRGG